MRRLVTSLVLLLVLGGNVLAGMPLHSNGQSCGMGAEMNDMDCCKGRKLDQKLTPEAAAAIVNCVLDCSQEGATPSGYVSIRQGQSAVVHFRLKSQVEQLVRTSTPNASHSLCSPRYSQPAYIRNLALLI